MDNTKQLVAKAIFKILQPIVRILLRYEISHSEFNELAKRSYIDVANKYFSIPKRKKTYSRVAVLTGLSRKEVVRLSQIEEDELPATKGPLNRATRVISGWLRDPDFLDADDKPLDLPLRDAAVSFDELVLRYSGDISARAILDELRRVGAVTQLDNQLVRLNQYGYVPQDSELEKVDVSAMCVTDLLNTVVCNIQSENYQTKFQRQVTYHNMPESVIKEFQQYSHEKSLALLIDFDHWLADKKTTVKPKEGETVGRVGVGIYFFQNNKDGE